MQRFKRKWKVLRFRYRLRRLCRKLSNQGVPNSVIANFCLSIAGEYPEEKIRQELGEALGIPPELR